MTEDMRGRGVMRQGGLEVDLLVHVRMRELKLTWKPLKGTRGQLNALSNIVIFTIYHFV